MALSVNIDQGAFLALQNLTNHMTTNAEMAAMFLRNSAAYLRSVGENNPSVREEMEANANSYEVMAELVENDPLGDCPMEMVPPMNPRPATGYLPRSGRPFRAALHSVE